MSEGPCPNCGESGMYGEYGIICQTPDDECRVVFYKDTGDTLI